MLTLRGKRWIYDIGGKRVSVENAWSWTGWAQERVVIDGVAVRAAGAMLTTERSFTIPVDETRLNAPLHVALYSRLFGVDCIVSYGDAVLDPADVQFGSWRDRKGGWPPAELSGSAGAAPPLQPRRP